MYWEKVSTLLAVLYKDFDFLPYFFKPLILGSTLFVYLWYLGFHQQEKEAYFSLWKAQAWHWRVWEVYCWSLPRTDGCFLDGRFLSFSRSEPFSIYINSGRVVNRTMKKTKKCALFGKPTLDNLGSFAWSSTWSTSSVHRPHPHWSSALQTTLLAYGGPLARGLMKI